MDIHKLEIFLDLSKTLNYTETAERQYTSQGNVSKQIMALEKELEVQLFDRAHKKIYLTKAGKAIMPYVENIVSQTQQMHHHLQELIQAKEELLQVLTIPTLINYQAFHKIIAFFNQHPEITLQLKEAETDILLQRLKQSQNTLLYTRFFQWNDLETDVLVMEEEKFVAILPETHPLAENSLIDLKALAAERFLVLSDSTLLKQPVIQLCRKAGFEPNIVNESARIELLAQMVKEGLGIAIMMEKSLVNPAEKNLVARPITPNQTSKLAFVKKRKEVSEAVLTFWQDLQK